MSEWLDRVHQGHALELLRKMPADSVDLCLTSPPYWGLRMYGEAAKTAWEDGWNGQLGLEPGFPSYLDHLLGIFQEVKRVLKPSGSLYVNIGDTYSTSLGNHHGKTAGYSEKKMLNDSSRPKVPGSLPTKSLCMIPERLALRLVDEGWLACRNRIVWHKPNHMPSSVKDRLTSSWEPIYHFAKGPRYFYNLDAIREPLKGRTFSFNIRIREAKKGVNIHKQGFTASREEIENYDESALAKTARARYNGKYSTGDVDPEKMNSPRARNMRKTDRHLLTGAGTKFSDWRRVQGQGQTVQSGLRVDGHQGDVGHPDGKNPGDVMEIGPETPRLGAIIGERGAVKVPGGQGWTGHWPGGGARSVREQDPRWLPPEGKNPGDFWTVTTRPFAEGHFAVFPEALCIRPILSSCPEEGVVLDPFAGAGTVGLVAKKLRRHYVLLEINPDYCRMAEKRLAAFPTRLDKFG